MAATASRVVFAPSLLIIAALGAQVVVPPTCSATGSCSQAISAAVSSCEGQASCQVVLQAGTYNISGAAHSSVFSFNGIPGLSITGAGPNETTLLMQDIFSLFNVDSCPGFTIAEFAVDNARLPFTLGVVTSVAAGVSTLSFDASFYPVDLARYAWLGSAQAAIQYNLSSGRLARGGVDDYWLPPNNRPITYVSTSGPGAAFTVPATFPVGAAMIVRHQVGLGRDKVGCTPLTHRACRLSPRCMGSTLRRS